MSIIAGHLMYMKFHEKSSVLIYIEQSKTHESKVPLEVYSKIRLLKQPPLTSELKI
jgi:hypothetical protein